MNIIIEGPDRTGKDTLIKSLIKEFPGMISIHCGSPAIPRKEYYKEYYENLYSLIGHSNRDFILNRSAVGEYVYGPLYRNNDYELSEIVDHNDFIDDFTLLFTLIDNPRTLLSREDGKSFGTSLEQKTEEIARFVEVTEYFNGYVISCMNKTPEQVFRIVMETIGDELS